MKLGDFGISKRVSNPSTALRTEVGTRAFLAPETTPDDYEETFQYTNAVDMWSLGCVIYNVLAHSLPYKNPRARSFPFPSQPLKDRVNDQGINLLECLLRVDPSTRWTAQEAVKHPWLHASGEGSSAAAEDATENSAPIAQPERSNESQDKSHRPDDQPDMPTFISSMEKTCPKPTDQTETPINQLTSQSSRHRGKNGPIDSSSNNDGRRRTTSDTLVLPGYEISDSFEDPGTETLTPRRARSRSPKDASRGLHESDTMKKPTSSPVTLTIVPKPPRQIRELANTSASRNRASSLDTTDPSWAGILEELKSMEITEDEIEENKDFIRDYIQQRKARGEPTPSPVTPTIVLRPPQQMSELANTSASRDRASSLDTTDLSWEGILEELKSMGITEDQIEENRDFIRDYILQRKGSGEPTYSPVTPTIASNPSNDGLGMSLGSSDDEENMDLVTILQKIYREPGDPEQNKIARALELIRKRVDLEMRSNGETALHLAVRICCSKKGGHFTRILHELLERGADVDALDTSGQTPLHTAISQYHKGDKTDVVRQLLKHGANVNAKGYLSRTPLHCTVLLPCVEYVDVLLAAGAFINELDTGGRTALHWTPFNKGQGKTIARKLILAGIDIDVIDKTGRTALDVAREFDNIGVIIVIEQEQQALDMARNGKKSGMFVENGEALEQLRRSYRDEKDARGKHPMGEYVFALE